MKKGKLTVPHEMEHNKKKKNAKKLRNTRKDQCKGVYTAPDLTYKEQQRNKELRKQQLEKKK